MSKRQYSDNDKAEALVALDTNNGNVSGTAKQLGIPRVTLLEWSKGRKMHPEVSEMRQEKKEELADLFEKVSRSYIGRALSDDAVNKTHGKDAVIAAATAADKMQLLRGKPTTIIAESAKATVQSIVKKTGLSEERARQIVADQFGINESELISEGVM